MTARRLILFAAILAGWLATGLFIVRGNERAVVRRFGRIVATPGGEPALRGSGLHGDLPWPLSQVDRVNFHEIRTVSLGQTETGDATEGGFLKAFDPADRSQFLTGDKNILHVRIDVQYRISEPDVADWLFGSDDPQRQLASLAEAALTDVVTAAGVDYVQTLGRADLQERLTVRLRELVAARRLGVDVETVALDDVRPPVRVKAAFLDVNDARADREKFVQSGLAYEEQKREQARGEARQIADQAAAARQQSVESARAKAESFERLVKQLRDEAERSGQSYAAVRQMTLRRRYLADVEQILKTASAKVFLDSGRQVDLTIVRPPTP
jgi:membrane protease subunit HflK